MSLVGVFAGGSWGLLLGRNGESGVSSRVGSTSRSAKGLGLRVQDLGSIGFRAGLSKTGHLACQFFKSLTFDASTGS